MRRRAGRALEGSGIDRPMVIDVTVVRRRVLHAGSAGIGWARNLRATLAVPRLIAARSPRSVRPLATERFGGEATVWDGHLVQQPCLGSRVSKGPLAGRQPVAVERDP